MKLLRTAAAWLLTPALCLLALAQGPSKRHFPSVLTYASLNQVAPPNSDSGWWFEIRHLDMAHGSDHFREIKRRDPGFFYIKYRLMESAPLGEEDRELDAFCKKRSLSPEDAYLHYSDDTRVQVQGKVFLNKGWGKGTAADKRESRIRAHMWDTWRFIYNPASSCTQAFMIARSVQDITQTSDGARFDGIFIDEVGPPDWASEMGVPPRVVSGGHILEYGDKTREEVAKSGEYLRGLVSLFSAVSAAMKAASHGRSLFLPNTANYTTDATMQLGLAADGLLTEGLCVESALHSARGDALFWDIAKKLASQGKIYIFTQGSEGPPTHQNFDAGNYPSTQDRHEMYSLASYWMAKQGDLTYYSLRPRWRPLSTFWVKAQEYDIGQPLGDYYVWKENDGAGDSAGQKYRIYRRDYSKALVLFRTRYDWDEKNSKDLGARSDFYDLGGSHRLLYADGTLGPPITRIALSLAEGVVLIPTEQVPLEAAPKPARSPQP